MFGETAAKVHQLGRAFTYWQLTKTVFETIYRARIEPGQEEAILDFVWSVLMAAATLTQVEAVKFCVADPLEQITRRLIRADAGSCRRAIASELRAREAGQLPTHVSLWGQLSIQTSFATGLR
ncbi:MAG TPA: hypothetical protein VGL86_21400 [Polyangia bacterium]